MLEIPGAEAALPAIHPEPRGPSFQCPHKPSIQGAAAGGAGGWLPDGAPAAPHCPLAQTGSRDASHHSPVPAALTHSVFQERMCLVWPRRCQPRDTENRLVPNTTVWTLSGPMSALRGQGSQELSSQRAVAPRRSRPFPGSVWAPGRDAGRLSTARNHTQSSLYGNKAGPGIGSFGLRETQVWVFSEGTTGPLS